MCIFLAVGTVEITNDEDDGDDKHKEKTASLTDKHCFVSCKDVVGNTRQSGQH